MLGVPVNCRRNNSLQRDVAIHIYTAACVVLCDGGCFGSGLVDKRRVSPAKAVSYRRLLPGEYARSNLIVVND